MTLVLELQSRLPAKEKGFESTNGLLSGKAAKGDLRNSMFDALSPAWAEPALTGAAARAIKN